MSYRAEIGNGVIVSALVLGVVALSSCQPNFADESDLIRETERRRLQALVDADMDVAEQLHADDFQLINPAGIARTKAEYLGNVAAGRADYQSWEPREIEVRQFGDAAIIRYIADLHIVLGGEDLGSRPHWHTDYYEKRNGNWQVVWSHATVVQQ